MLPHAARARSPIWAVYGAAWLLRQYFMRRSLYLNDRFVSAHSHPACCCTACACAPAAAGQSSSATHASCCASTARHARAAAHITDPLHHPPIACLSCHSYAPTPLQLVATACTFLALKVFESPKHLSHVAAAFEQKRWMRQATRRPDLPKKWEDAVGGT